MTSTRNIKVPRAFSYFQCYNILVNKHTEYRKENQMFIKHRYFVFDDNARQVLELTLKQVYYYLTEGYTVVMIK